MSIPYGFELCFRGLGLSPGAASSDLAMSDTRQTAVERLTALSKALLSSQEQQVNISVSSSVFYSRVCVLKRTSSAFTCRALLAKYPEGNGISGKGPQLMLKLGDRMPNAANELSGRLPAA